MNDEGLLVIFVIKVAADGFFNNLADDSDIIKSGPKIDKDNYVVITSKTKKLFNIGNHYMHLWIIQYEPEKFGFIWALLGALTLADFMSGVIPLMIR